MGHLTIVNNETINDIFDTGFISTRGDLGSYLIKTVSDLFSDVLATRPGDLVFPWTVKMKKSKNINLGFQYFLKIAGPPIYVFGEKYPIKIPIEKVFRFENPLSEEEAFDLFNSKLLWNAIGKKSLGRGHSITHQTKFEDDLLQELLKNKNKNIPTEINIKSLKFKNSLPISINLDQNILSQDFIEDLEKIEVESRISQLVLSKLHWSDKECFSYEKTLEAWLMENIDKKKCFQMWELLDIKNINIQWFGNYLSYGVTGKNIDVVATVTIGNIKKIFVFELKKDRLSYNSYGKVANQVFEYANFIKRALTSFETNVKLEIIPVVLSLKSNDFPRNKIIVKSDINVNWIGYHIYNGDVIFNNHFIL